MVVEVGHFALILALCVALVQAALPLAGALRGVRSWMDSAPVLAMAQLLGPDIIKLDPGVKGTVENMLTDDGVPAVTLELGYPQVFDVAIDRKSVV